MDTLLQVLELEPAPPQRLNAAIHLDLQTITLKCLEKDPARRYASAQELVDELERFLSGEPIHARPVSRPERLWRWCKRSPALATASGLALVAMTGTVVTPRGLGGLSKPLSQ